MQDAQNKAELIKSAPDNFEKSVTLLIHILYQKALKNDTVYDKVLDIPT